jgi:hypothetical protein
LAVSLAVIANPAQAGTTHHDSWTRTNTNSGYVEAEGHSFRYQIPEGRRKGDSENGQYITSFTFNVKFADGGLYPGGAKSMTALADDEGFVWGYDCVLESTESSDCHIPYQSTIRITVDAGFSGCGNYREVVNEGFIYDGGGLVVAAPDLRFVYPVVTEDLGDGTRNTSYTLMNVDDEVTVRLLDIQVFADDSFHRDIEATPHVGRGSFGQSPLIEILMSWGPCNLGDAQLSMAPPGLLLPGSGITIDLPSVPMAYPYIYTFGRMAYQVPGLGPVIETWVNVHEEAFVE